MKSKKMQIVASLALYGNREIGAGWLAQVKGVKGEDGRPVVFGDHDPKRDRSFSNAIAEGMAEIRSRKVMGLVRICDAGGARFVDIRLDSAVYYADLMWKENK